MLGKNMNKKKKKLINLQKNLNKKRRFNFPKGLEEMGITSEIYNSYNMNPFYSTLFRGLDKWDDNIKKDRINYLKKYGFSNVELWNLDITIALFVYPRLVKFREDAHTFPGNMTFKEWQEILDKMILAFRRIIEDDCGYDLKTGGEYLGYDNNEYQKIQEEIKEGLELFGKYLRSLWN